MKTAHKLIKYLAIALAVMIIAGICSAAVSLFSGFSLGFSYSGSKTDPEKVFSGDETSVLYIDIAASNVRIHSDGTALTGVTDNEHISIEVKENKLVATEAKHSNLKTEDTYLDITVPSGFVFEKIVIKTGAGVIEADELLTEELELSLGAGEVTIGSLTATDEVSIEGGAGDIVIKDGVINDLDVELGVGSTDIRAEVTGESDIEAGVGELRLTLLGERDSYKIKASTGIGEFRIDGEKLSNNITFGSGGNVISVDGGIGSIEIRFE